MANKKPTTKKPTTKKPSTKQTKPIVEEEPKPEQQAKEPVSDVKKYGNTDMFELLGESYSRREGWMKTTKAMQVRGGCLVQVSTQQRNPDGSYAIAEALTFVPNVWITDDVNGGKKLTQPKK